MRKHREGWLSIDNSFAPGPGGVARLEIATLTCNHCQRQILKRLDRTREREWCYSCDKYICDPCAAVRQVVGCVTFRSIIDAELTKAHRALATKGVI